ncbi:MAG: hypothetical protein KME04_11125 [Pleurocapsa minor GSE-CHR-MK-17-07R]|jgi:hypothetical protein|nr:hypothetical protein [Pleurocapsa minor GSE-CHR-MK 17-07R]
MNHIEPMLMGVITETVEMRDQVLGLISDQDLGLSLGGDNPPFALEWALLAETQRHYTDALRTFRMTWEGYAPNMADAQSVASLKAVFARQDAEMDAVLNGLSADDVASRQVDHGEWQQSVDIHMSVYREALLIFLSRAVVHLRFLRKPIPEKIQLWIG